MGDLRSLGSNLRVLLERHVPQSRSPGSPDDDYSYRLEMAELTALQSARLDLSEPSVVDETIANMGPEKYDEFCKALAGLVAASNIYDQREPAEEIIDILVEARAVFVMQEGRE